jgi:hypothetical protein
MRRSPSSDERVELLTVPQGSGFKKVRIQKGQDSKRSGIIVFLFFPKDAKNRANVSLVSNEIAKVFSAYLYEVSKIFTSGKFFIFS